MKTIPLYDRILKATFIKSLSPFREKQVKLILSHTENDPMDVANRLCEYLHIDKRYNRSAIIKELNKA